jgi:predicted exporter
VRTVGAYAWLAIIIFSTVYLSERWRDGFQLSTDLLALLPAQYDARISSIASQKVTSSLSRDAVFLFSHPTPVIARRAASDFVRDVSVAGFSADVNGRVTRAEREKLAELFFSHRNGLLSNGDRKRLLTGRELEIYRRAIARIFSPIGGLDSRLLRMDPFQLFPEYLGNLSPTSDGASIGRELAEVEADGTVYVMVSINFAHEPYALSFQSRFITWFENWKTEHGGQESEPGRDLEILRAGAIFYAHAGARQGLEEGGVIGGITLIGLVVFVFMAFGSLQPLWLSLLSIVSGLTVALATNLLLFDNLHFVAVIFGAGLIGVSVDYSLHYCCERFGVAASPTLRLKRILPAATIGVITSTVGFLVLALAPFPGLRQISMISAVGLTTAYFTVIIWFPIFDRSSNRPAKRWLILASNVPRKFWKSGSLRLLRCLVLVAVAAAVAAGGSRFSISDDVTQFQALSAELRTEEKAIRELVGNRAALQFAVVAGNDEEERLQREEALLERLEPLQDAYRLDSVVAISRFVPSASRQVENQALVQRILHSSLIQRLETQTGLTFDIDVASNERDPLTLDAFRAVAPRALFDRLTLDIDPDSQYHIVLLFGIADGNSIKAITETIEGIEYVDPVSELSALFGEYRWIAVFLLCGSILLIAPILWLRYGALGSFWVIAPPLAAVLTTPFLVALAGDKFTFFNVMALVLVFAVGIDYALFCREVAIDGRNINSLANGLAASSTILSFGLLAFSSIPAVHSFGLTVFLGIGLSFILAPLAEQKLDDGTENDARN